MHYHHDHTEITFSRNVTLKIIIDVKLIIFKGRITLLEIFAAFCFILHQFHFHTKKTSLIPF